MTIKLDRERKVRFDTAAIIQIEEHLDCSIYEILKDETKLMRLGTIVVVIWAGLEDELDLEYVKKNFPLNRLIEISTQIYRILNKDMGGDEEAYDEKMAESGIKKKGESIKTSDNGSKKLKGTATVS